MQKSLEECLAPGEGSVDANMCHCSYFSKDMWLKYHRHVKYPHLGWLKPLIQIRIQLLAPESFPVLSNCAGEYRNEGEPYPLSAQQTSASSSFHVHTHTRDIAQTSLSVEERRGSGNRFEKKKKIQFKWRVLGQVNMGRGKNFRERKMVQVATPKLI